MCMGSRYHVSILAQRKNYLFTHQSPPWVSRLIRLCKLFLLMVASLLQGGFIPDLILYLSCILSPMPAQLGFQLTNLSDFYTKYELPFRLALFWCSSYVCAIFASFLAAGVLRMRGVLGKAGWQSVTTLLLYFLKLMYFFFQLDGYSLSSE